MYLMNIYTMLFIDLVHVLMSSLKVRSALH